jgi:hypothetical protein
MSQQPANMTEDDPQLRRNRLYLDHPDPSPDQAHPADYLIHPPGRLASNATWRRFRDETVIPFMAGKPDDQNLPRYAARVEEILAWRAGVPTELRFWKPDPTVK